MENSFETYANINRPEMLEFVPAESAIILDVGCSTGNFGASLKRERDVTVWGVEIDKSAAQIASTKLDNVICGSFEREISFPTKFDCIVFNDVLEHMVDPYGAIAFARDLITENGRIVASVPNVRFFDNIWHVLVNKDWEYQEAGILDRTHLRFFTRKSIERMFREAGLEITRMAGINPIETQSSYLERRYRIINRLLLNSLEDMRWLQFAVVAKTTASTDIRVSH